MGSLSYGIRGNWYLQGVAATKGRFHVWPTMQGWDVSTHVPVRYSADHESIVLLRHDESHLSHTKHQYCISTSNECVIVICFDRTIRRSRISMLFCVTCLSTIFPPTQGVFCCWIMLRCFVAAVHIIIMTFLFVFVLLHVFIFILKY